MIIVNKKSTLRLVHCKTKIMSFVLKELIKINNKYIIYKNEFANNVKRIKKNV